MDKFPRMRSTCKFPPTRFYVPPTENKFPPTEFKLRGKKLSGAGTQDLRGSRRLGAGDLGQITHQMVRFAVLRMIGFGCILDKIVQGQ